MAQLELDAPHGEESKRYVHWLITKHEKELDFKLLRKNAKKYDLHKRIESILYDLKPILERR